MQQAEEIRSAIPFDFGSLIEPVVVRWRGVLLSSLLFLLMGLITARAILRPSYSVAVQLARHEPPLASDSFKPQSPSTDALFGIVTSLGVLQNTGDRLSPSQSAGQVAHRLQFTKDRTSELITITATGPNPAAAIALARAVLPAEALHDKLAHPRHGPQFGREARRLRSGQQRGPQFGQRRFARSRLAPLPPHLGQLR